MENDQELQQIIEAVVREELGLNEGFLKTLKKAADYATRIAYIQATKGPEGIKDELIDKLESFVQKAQGKTKGFMAQAMLKDLSDKVQEIQTQRHPGKRHRDYRGRYASQNKRVSG